MNIYKIEFYKNKIQILKQITTIESINAVEAELDFKEIHPNRTITNIEILESNTEGDYYFNKAHLSHPPPLNILKKLNKQPLCNI